MDTNLSDIEAPENLRINEILYDQAYLSGRKIYFLTWDEYEHEQLAGFNMYYRPKDRFWFTKLNDVLLPDIHYEPDLVVGTEYSFCVTAVLKTGEESGYSNIVSEY